MINNEEGPRWEEVEPFKILNGEVIVRGIKFFPCEKEGAENVLIDFFDAVTKHQNLKSAEKVLKENKRFARKEGVIDCRDLVFES
ncbi:MAG: hypothetical protein GF387_01410 [Candidatus Portnoybacteria bacterium]|nr:hypothetical protein [Candidatus Portnoybacteria bacterium]